VFVLLLLFSIRLRSTQPARRVLRRDRRGRLSLTVEPGLGRAIGHLTPVWRMAFREAVSTCRDRDEDPARMRESRGG